MRECRKARRRSWSYWSSLTATLLPAHSGDGADAGHVERVDVTTLDAFAAERGLEAIDLLKIDAEGCDLDVLEGARGLLGGGRVAFVVVEVGFRRGAPGRTLFDDAGDLLAARGLHPFGVYEQRLEWSGAPRLRFANAVFARS